MSSRSWDPSGEASQALREAVNSYGIGVLSNPRALSNLLKDLLPDSSREAVLLVPAAESDVADMLRQQEGQHLDTDSAVRFTASVLADRRALEPTACLWATVEFARALGYPVADAPPPAEGRDDQGHARLDRSETLATERAAEPLSSAPHPLGPGAPEGPKPRQGARRRPLHPPPDTPPQVPPIAGPVGPPLGRPPDHRPDSRPTTASGPLGGPPHGGPPHPGVDPKAAYNLARQREKRHDLAGAAVAYKALTECADEEVAASANCNLGNLLRKSGDLPGARVTLQRAVDSGRPAVIPAASYNLGMVFEQQRQPDEARRAYLRTIAAGKAGDPIVTAAKLRKALLKFRRIR